MPLSPSLDAQRRRQEALVTWLLARSADARRVDTHASTVVLAGEEAYKLKRALDLGWMDFSTLEKREAACRRELALNRRTAPDLYLDVVPVYAAGDGFSFEGSGTPVEWLVLMRRFDEDCRFDRLLAAGRLDAGLAERLADHIAAFHGAAEVCPDDGGHALIAGVLRENTRDLAAHDAVIDQTLSTALAEASETALRLQRPLLEARRAGGWVRRCHGDLHLANIVLWQGEPTLYDCIEFNEGFSRIDLFYDLAFLLMDLDRFGRRDLANLVLNRWLMDPAQLPGLALLPLFLSVRAAVRAKVTAMAAGLAPAERRAPLTAEARDYAERAFAYLSPPPPRLVAVGGFSGSGKSSLAKVLAPLLGPAPGALVVRSDVVRKRLFGVPPEQPLPVEAYSPDWHRRVAKAMLAQAEAALTAGQAVILDAVHGQAATQEETEVLAQRLSVPFTGLWLSAPREVLLARVAARRGDASDATVEVVERQLAAGEPQSGWLRLDATGSLAEVLERAKGALGLAAESRQSVA